MTEIDDVDERVGKKGILILNDENFPYNEIFHFKIVFLTYSSNHIPESHHYKVSMPSNSFLESQIV